MGSTILLKLIFIVILALVVKSSPDTAGSEARVACNNKCGSMSELMCANNGITYANLCRFNCAKDYNRRLKFVKAGSCAGTTLKEYRGGQASRPTQPPARYPSYPSSSPSHSQGGVSGWRSLFRF